MTEDGIASIQNTVVQYVLVKLRRRNANNVSRTDAYWGTARLSQDQGLAIRTSDDAPDYDYNYDESSGDGVDIYILGEFHAYFVLCDCAQTFLRYRRLHRTCTFFFALGACFPLFNHELISLISAVAPPGERHLVATQMQTGTAMVNSFTPFTWCQVSDI